MKSESYLAVGPLWTTRAYRQASQFNAFDTSGSTLMSGLKLVCCMENMLKHHPFNPSCQPQLDAPPAVSGSDISRSSI